MKGAWMVNGDNGNGWKQIILIALAAMLGAAISIGISQIEADANLAPRVTALEREASKGERWTLQDQIKYMEMQNQIHSDLSAHLAEMEVKIGMICRATNAGC